MEGPGSGSEPMPFAIDLLAGFEILLSIGAFFLIGISELAQREAATMVPVMRDIYPRAFHEPAPTAVALLAGPPILIAIGLFLRKRWGQVGATVLHVLLGLCSLWHFFLRFSPVSTPDMRSPDVAMAMLFLLALSVGVPLFLRRKHMRAAFARGHR